MSDNAILSFSFSEGNINKIFSQINAKKGDGILALRIKNFITLRSMTTDEQLNEILYDSKSYFCKYLQENKLQPKPNIFVALPFYFASIKYGKNVAKLVSDFEAAINGINVSVYDAQFTLTYSPIEEMDNETQTTLIRNVVGNIAHNHQLTGIIKYNPEIISKIQQEYTYLSLLKSALKGKMARFAYQPIIDCQTGKTAYHECLLRIPGENGEIISAGKHIALAEKYGIINYVDNAVIEMAASELKCAPDLQISVNISNIGLLDDRLIEKMKKCLKSKKIASRLIIEITETAVNYDIEKTIRFVETVRNLGCKIAIDDFGAGSTSLGQLKNIKFDILKIDGSLIRDIANNEYSRFLVEMLVKIAAEVRAKTVAEYVEDGTIAKFILDLNVDYMQGNFFSEAKNHRTWGKK